MRECALDINVLSHTCYCCDAVNTHVIVLLLRIYVTLYTGSAHLFLPSDMVT